MPCIIRLTVDGAMALLEEAKLEEAEQEGRALLRWSALMPASGARRWRRPDHWPAPSTRTRPDESTLCSTAWPPLRSETPQASAMRWAPRGQRHCPRYER